MMDERCGTCRYFARFGVMERGHCRYNAPKLGSSNNPANSIGTEMGRWPIVGIGDFCGEHHPDHDPDVT
jgi:hypothetical protein